MGHLTRCRTLASELQRYGIKCSIVGPKKIYASAADAKLFMNWDPLEWGNATDDSKLTTQLANEYGANFLVLDDYRINEEYQIFLRLHGFKWLQFEARKDRPIWADVVINFNPLAVASDYSEVLRNPNSKLLLGPRYSLLRSEFLNISTRDISKPLRKVLITFGGGDDLGLIIFALATLMPKADQHIEFVVMSSAHNPRNSEIEEWIKDYGHGRVSLKIGPSSVATLFTSCDLAIMAAGTSIYEAACCKLPMILIAIAENQVDQAECWSASNEVTYLGRKEEVTSEKLLKAFKFFAENPVVDEPKKRGNFFVDAKGASRVCKFILAEL